jgi:hypothetical protein
MVIHSKLFQNHQICFEAYLVQETNQENILPQFLSMFNFHPYCSFFSNAYTKI